MSEAADQSNGGIAPTVEQWLVDLASDILQAPVDPNQSLIAQGLDSLGAEELLQALQDRGFEADYEFILDEASLTTLVAALKTAKSDGPVPLTDAETGQPFPLTAPQTIWAGLDDLGWGSWANISLCLSLPASVLPAAFLPAIAQSLCDANDAMRLVLCQPETPGGPLLQRRIDGFQIPVQTRDAPGTDRDAMRLVEAFEGEEVSPFTPSTRALVLASQNSDGRHWLCLTMHHIFSDRVSMHGLARQIRAMVAERSFTGPTAPEIGFADVAIWQNSPGFEADRAQARLDLGGQLAGADLEAARPAPALADPDTLDLGTVPAISTLRASESDGLEALARRLETTVPLLLHAAYSELVTGLTGDTEAAQGHRDMVACHVVSNRERHAALKDLVGCLDTSVPVPVRLGEDLSLIALCAQTRGAFAAASRCATDLPRGEWTGHDADDAALFERIPHINIVRALQPTAGPGGDLDIREHSVRRTQKTRWGLLLRVTLPPSGQGADDAQTDMQVIAVAEDQALATAVQYCFVELLRRLLSEPLDDVADLKIRTVVDEVIARAAFASAQVARAAQLLSDDTDRTPFIYEKLVARQQRWYAHDARMALVRDDKNRFVGTAENPFPFTQLDKLAEREFLEGHGIPLPTLRHVLPGDGFAPALSALAPDLPDSFALKPVGAGHSFGVTLVRDGHDLTRNGTPFDPARVGAELAQMAERGFCRHEGRDFPFNFSAFLIEDLVLDANGFPAPTDYKVFVIGDELLWVQLHFKADGHTWVAFVDAEFKLLPHPAWDPVTCWRTHRALVCTEQSMVDARRPDCLADMIAHSTRLASELGLFVRLDWYADAARGPLMGEITTFPHMLQPRGFYTPWANARVKAAWQDPDGARPASATGKQAVDLVDRAEAVMNRAAQAGSGLAEILNEEAAQPWAIGEAVSRAALQAFILGFDLAPWSISAGDRVALVMDNGLPLAATLLATMQRYVAVPLGPDLPAEHMAAQITESGVSAVLVLAGSDAAQKAQEAKTLAEGLVVIELQPSQVSPLPSLPAAPRNATAGPTPARGPDDAVLVLRTSGSTGEPKRVCLTLDHVLRSGALIGQSLQLSPEDIGLNMLPLHHVGGIACNLIAPLLAGTRCRFAPAFNPKAFVDALAGRQGASWCYLVPAMWDMVLGYAAAHPELRETRPWPNLRAIRSASAELPHATAKALADLFGPDVSILPTYGMTEAMPIAAPPLPYRLERPGSVGTVLPGIEVEIIDPDAGPDMPRVPHGQVGEVTVKGATVISGYEGGGSAAASDAFTPRGYFRTGDLGALAEDGSRWLTISGRQKDAINRGGETIAPAEVEAMLRDYPGWAEPAGSAPVMAFARADADLGEAVAVAVAAPGGMLDLPAFRSWTQTHMPAHMVPQTVVTVADLPRSDGGKLLRARFAQTLSEHLAPSQHGTLDCYAFDGPGAPPRLVDQLTMAADASHAEGANTATLETVMALVQDFVGDGVEIGPDTRLDDAGVNSLAAVELAARLNARFNRDLPQWVVSDFPTPRALLSQLSDGPAPALDAAATTPATEPAAEPTTETRGPVRMLFLHGEGADADLMDISLQATHWTGKLAGQIEFVFLDAPHICAPKPEFHASAVAAGLYGKPEYRSWGAPDAATLDQSIKAVETALAELGPFDAIGGICDGGLIAALVASRNPDLRAYLNVSSSPMSRLAPSMASREWRVACPSLHLISHEDEMHSLAEQLELSGRCDVVRLIQHDRGHAVPVLTEQMQDELGDLVSAIAGDRTSTVQAPTTVAVSDARLAEIAARVAEHPQVDHAVILNAPPAPDGAGRLYGFVVLDPHSTLPPPDLRAALRGHVPEAELPARFLPLDAIPRAADGSVHKDALLDRMASSPVPYAAPTTQMEKDLAAIWQKILMMENAPGIDDDFFDIGGYSLLAVILMREIEQHIGQKPDTQALLRLSTIRQLAQALEGHAPVSDRNTAFLEQSGLSPDIWDAMLSHTVAWKGSRARADALVFGLNTEGTRTPIFWCCQRFHEVSQLAAHIGPDQPVFGMRSGVKVMEKTTENIEALARYYSLEILSLRPNGPIIVGGTCQASKIAFQIARILHEGGHDLALLCLHEQIVPSTYTGPVALFFGDNSNHGPMYYFDNPGKSWEPFYPNVAAVHRTQARHTEHFLEPHVQGMAAALRGVVDHVNAKTTVDRKEGPVVPGPALTVSGRRARLAAPKRLTFLRGKQQARIDVTVTNTSDITWFAADGRGPAVGYWLYREKLETMPLFFGVGESLSSDLAPGQSATLSLEIEVPSRPGRFRADIDMIDNGVAWFRDGGSPVASVSLDTRSKLLNYPTFKRALRVASEKLSAR